MDRWRTEIKDIASAYNGLMHNLEMSRLQDEAPVEFAITCRQLTRRVQPGWRVLDVGSGTGHYAELLARMGCDLQLVDISDRLLETALGRLAASGLEHRVLGVDLTSATDLSMLPSADYHAVLLLGPLYHLCGREERSRAVSEAVRVLRQGGVLIASGINRLAYLRDLFREQPDLVEDRRTFHRDFLCHGNLDPAIAPHIGFAHLSTAEEFRSLFQDGLCELALIGVESFTAPCPSRFHTLSSSEKEAWLDLVEETGTTPEGLCCSDHFLYVGERSDAG